MALVESFVAHPPPLRVDADGVVRVGDSRVTLDLVVDAYEEGATAEEVVLRYDSLRLADVYDVFGYYLRHRQEVDAYLADRRAQAAEIRRKTEDRFPSSGLRERLLARRSQKP